MEKSDTPLYEIIGPTGGGPMPLIVHSLGWVDCGDAIARIIETIRFQGQLETIARFDTNQLVDHRSHRPTLNLVDGLRGKLEWPSIELAIGTDRDNKPFMLLDGPEPDYNWRPYVDAVAHIANEVGISALYSIGAYPTPAAHTRPIVLTHSASSNEMLGNRHVTKGAITVPVGVSVAIADALAPFGIEWLGYWAQMPYYLSGNQWPQASVALLEALCADTGLIFDLAQLKASIPEARAALEAIVTDNGLLSQVIPQLEQRHDEMLAFEEGIDTGTDFETALEAFLNEEDQ